MDNAGLADRIDVFEVEQFIALNLYQLGKFGADGRRLAVSDFVTRYNEIIDDVETDPSLKESCGPGRTNDTKSSFPEDCTRFCTLPHDTP